jgi:hypothetical protein
MSAPLLIPRRAEVLLDTSGLIALTSKRDKHHR